MYYLLEVIKRLTQLGFIQWSFNPNEKTTKVNYREMKTFRVMIGEYELLLTPKIFEKKRLLFGKSKYGHIIFQIKGPTGIEEEKDNIKDGEVMVGPVVGLYKSIPEISHSNLQKDFYKELTRIFKIKLI